MLYPLLPRLVLAHTHALFHVSAEKTGCSIPAVKPSEPRFVPESTEDWDRDLKMEEKLFRTRLTQQSLLLPRDHDGAQLNRSLEPNASISFQSKAPVTPGQSFIQEPPAARWSAAASAARADQRSRSNATEARYHSTREPTSASIVNSTTVFSRGVG